MPDLQIPQRQTFPAIRGSASDEVGLLPLDTAITIDLVLNGPGGTPIVVLPCVPIEPPETFTVDGTSFLANWEAPLGSAGAAVATEVLYRAKLKIVWQTSPLLVQYAPQVDFMEIEIVENVVEA